jgi:hypothetical protein
LLCSTWPFSIVIRTYRETLNAHVPPDQGRMLSLTA